MFEVELAGLDAKQVAGRTRDEARLTAGDWCEHLTQARDLIAQRVVGGGHALLDEELLDQPLARDNAVRAQEQEGEQRALLRPAHRNRVSVDPHREWTENPKLELGGWHRTADPPPPGRAIPGGETTLGQHWDKRAARLRRCSTRPSASGPV